MNTTLLNKELVFKAVRSSGAGGQNVNKVSSKVVLSFNPLLSEAFTPVEKERLLSKIGHKLSKEGLLILNCDTDRSQLKNKSLVTQRFFTLITDALAVQAFRFATKIPKSVIKKRLQDKKMTGQKKFLRKKFDF